MYFSLDNAAPMAAVALGIAGSVCGLYLLGSLATGRFAVENAAYAVVRRVSPPRAPSFEVREYAPHWVAETVVADAAPLREAASSGFRRIAGYIFGGTADGSKIAMTAPVQLEPRVGSARGGASHAVRFVLPRAFDAASPPPPPVDVRVTTRSVPRAFIAVRALPLSVSRMDDARFQAAAEALAADIDAAGIERVAAHAPVQLSYDPPWVPFFMQRNEVAIEVAAGTGAPFA